MLIQSVKGMHDILPDEQLLWEKIRQTARNIANDYNFSRLDTPAVESADLFERSAGLDSDIVEKQMYFVKSKGNERLVLRPEGTAPAVRSYFEHGLARMGLPLKIYYFAPMFRYEQPQAGRYRQHHQLGFEILGGENDPIYDAQIISVIIRFLEELKIKNASVHINSIGCLKCRAAYSKKLEAYYRKYLKEICKDCQKRLGKNPLRLLDCKNERCQIVKTEAPIILNFICESCKRHFKSVLEYLDELKIAYSINSHLVRGLDYYNRTVFEIFTEGFSFAIASGGRFDYLAEMLKLKKLNAMGGCLGIERVAEAIKSAGKLNLTKTPSKVFFIHIGDEAKKKGLVLVDALRRAGVKTGESFGKESLKAQLKIADKEGSLLALILGQREVFEESVIIRDMTSGAQETIALSKVIEEVKKRL